MPLPEIEVFSDYRMFCIGRPPPRPSWETIAEPYRNGDALVVAMNQGSLAAFRYGGGFNHITLHLDASPPTDLRVSSSSRLSVSTKQLWAGDAKAMVFGRRALNGRMIEVPRGEWRVTFGIEGEHGETGVRFGGWFERWKPDFEVPEHKDLPYLPAFTGEKIPRVPVITAQEAEPAGAVEVPVFFSTVRNPAPLCRVELLAGPDVYNQGGLGQQVVLVGGRRSSSPDQVPKVGVLCMLMGMSSWGGMKVKLAALGRVRLTSIRLTGDRLVADTAPLELDNELPQEHPSTTELQELLMSHLLRHDLADAHPLKKGVEQLRIRRLPARVAMWIAVARALRPAVALEVLGEPDQHRVLDRVLAELRAEVPAVPATGGVPELAVGAPVHLELRLGTGQVLLYSDGPTKRWKRLPSVLRDRGIHPFALDFKKKRLIAWRTDATTIQLDMHLSASVEPPEEAVVFPFLVEEDLAVGSAVTLMVADQVRQEPGWVRVPHGLYDVAVWEASPGRFQANWLPCLRASRPPARVPLFAADVPNEHPTGAFEIFGDAEYQALPGAVLRLSSPGEGPTRVVLAPLYHRSKGDLGTPEFGVLADVVWKREGTSWRGQAFPTAVYRLASVERIGGRLRAALGEESVWWRLEEDARVTALRAQLPRSFKKKPVEWGLMGRVGTAAWVADVAAHGTPAQVVGAAVGMTPYRYCAGDLYGTSALLVLDKLKSLLA